MPEKTLNEIPRSLRELYEKGLSALHKSNNDYALAIFEQVLSSEPAFFDCREALRAAQFKKAGNQGGLFKRLIGTASASPMLAKAQVLLRTDPKEALKVAEQLLRADPNSIAAHKVVAEAALACDLPRTAALSLEIAQKHGATDKDTVLRLGEALVRSGQVAKAEAVLTELSNAHPRDPDIAMALKNASASRTMSEGGYEKLADGTGSYRDILRDTRQAASLEMQNRQVQTEDTTRQLIDEYEARLAQEPTNLRLLRSLAEIYGQCKDFDRSLHYYGEILRIEGGTDPTVDRAIAETTARKYDHLKGLLDPQSADYPAEAERIEQEKQTYLLQECKSRAERYPSDLQIRFELGQRLLQLGRISEAIPEFQKAQANPHRKIAALACLGQCFARRGMHDLAARSFQNALKEKEVFDDEKKDLLYLLGTTYEKLGKPAEAIEQFKAIYEVDIGFRDVAERVDACYAAQEAAASAAPRPVPRPPSLSGPA